MSVFTVAVGTSRSVAAAEAAELPKGKHVAARQWHLVHFRCILVQRCTPKEVMPIARDIQERLLWTVPAAQATAS